MDSEPSAGSRPFPAVIFSQADRLFLGVSLGAVTVAAYALCTQLAQPIYGFAASGLHFLFPHLAERHASRAASRVRKTILIASACNLLFVAVGNRDPAALRPEAFCAYGRALISPEALPPIFPIIVWSSALLALNVTGTYALFAFGRIRIVTWLNLAAGATMLLLMVWLLPRFGAYGMAMARLCYGAITLLIYLPLARQLSKAPKTHMSHAGSHRPSARKHERATYKRSTRPRSLSISHASARTSQLPFATCVGFYFSFRLFFPLLAVRAFGQDAQAGVVLSLALNYLLLLLAVIESLGKTPSAIGSPLRWPCFRWALLFLAFSGISLFWSVTASLSAAAAFWCAMAADTAIVVLLLRGGPVDSVVNSLMRGYIWGSCAIAVIAWLLPAQSDLRLGDEELLGPNQIGWACAFAFFLAQYLMRRKSGNWTMPALLLAITLLRSLSKTTIIAFLVGQAYILLRDRSIRRRTKLLRDRVCGARVFVFSHLLSDYYIVYTNAGNQAETLTGRFGIWLYFLGEASPEAVDRARFPLRLEDHSAVQRRSRHVTRTTNSSSSSMPTESPVSPS